MPTLHNPRAAKAEDVAQFFNGMPPATAQAMPAPPDAPTDAPTDTETAALLDVDGALSTALARAFAHATALAHSGAKAQPVLITGSLYLLAEFFSLYPAYLSPTASAQGEKSS